MFYNNKSLDRALQILSTFNAEQPNFTLAELSEAVHVPKATVLGFARPWYTTISSHTTKR